MEFDRAGCPKIAGQTQGSEDSLPKAAKGTPNPASLEGLGRRAGVSGAIAIWQARLGREITAGEAEEISQTLVGFFSVLNEWQTNSASERTPTAVAVAPPSDRTRP